MNEGGRSKPVRIERLAIAARVISQHFVDKAFEFVFVVGGGLRPANVFFQFRQEESRDLILLGRGDGSQSFNRLFHEACHAKDYNISASTYLGMNCITGQPRN
jgi:hypothetical protein